MTHSQAALRLAMLIVVLFGTSGLPAQTQGELDQEACGQLRKADVAMNETYSRILKEYEKDEPFVTKMKAAQKAWLAFRDAELEALFPKANKQAEYGSVYPMCRCTELQSLTEERTKQLRTWLDGFREGDVCSGSVKIAHSTRSFIIPEKGEREETCSRGSEPGQR